MRDATPVKTWIELTFLQQLRFKVNKIQVYSAGLDLIVTHCVVNRAQPGVHSPNTASVFPMELRSGARQRVK